MARLFFAIPLPYDQPDSFWFRECGPFVLSLREKGHEAFLVTLNSRREQPPDRVRPVINCTLEEMSTAAWWQALRPDGIVLNLWGAPRYDAIRKAALAATPRVIESLDTSGVRIPRIWPRFYFVQTWGIARDNGKNAALAFVEAALRTVAFRYVPALMERPMAETMAQLPYVVAECPLAAARTERHIRLHSQAPVRIAQIPHPVYTRNMFYPPGQEKTNALVAVGRWDSYQKDFPLLLRSAVDFLRRQPDWTFDVVGGGVEAHRRLLDRIPAEIRSRIHVHGPLPHERVAEINRRARIHFIASRWEGFCNASAEALCCGCSYVGPIDLAASSFLVETESGTIAPRRHPADLCDALCAEVEAWRAGRRDPAAISRKWIAESGYHEVARRTLDLLETIPLPPA